MAKRNRGQALAERQRVEAIRKGLEDLVGDFGIKHKIQGIAEDCQKILRGCTTTNGTGTVSSFECPQNPISHFPAGWDLYRKRRANDARNLVLMCFGLHQAIEIPQADLLTAANYAFHVGVLWEKLVFRSKYGRELTTNIKNRAALKQKNLLDGKDNRRAIIEARNKIMAQRPRIKKEALVARIKKETGLGRSAIYNHLAEKKSSPRR